MELEVKKETIVNLLDKLRRYNLTIGIYEASIINSEFKYSVKVTNGRIIIPFELVQDFENDQFAIEENRYNLIANTFIKNSEPIVLPKNENKNQTIEIQEVKCNWCLKITDKDAIRCHNCRKLRKDIYEDKIKCYTFLTLGGIFIGLAIGAYFADREYILISEKTEYFIIFIGGILSIIGLYFYVRASEKLKTYWWA